MKTIIVYYSLEGNAEYCAHRIQDRTGGELLRLIPRKDTPRSGIGKYLVGGFEASTGKKADLQSITKDMNDYDLIILGCPVWAGTYPPAVGTFLKDFPFHGKKLGIFACSKSGNAEKMIEKIEEERKDCETAAAVSLIDPRSNKEKCDPELDAFADKLMAEPADQNDGGKTEA